MASSSRLFTFNHPSSLIELAVPGHEQEFQLKDAKISMVEIYLI
jgi:hypothetical protein